MITISYLTDRYKGKYRIRPTIDASTNNFPHNLINDSINDNDIYIDCANHVQVFYYGKGILHAYIPSKQRGNNYVKNFTEKFGKDIVFDIQCGDNEVMFKFKAKDDDKILPELKPRTVGAKISPFSQKNLPKSKYIIPDNDLKLYKDITSKIDKNEMLKISRITNDFLHSICKKKDSWEEMRANMLLVGLKGKEYIHSIDKWQQYLDFLKANI